MGCGVSKDNREPTRVLLVGSSGCGKSTIIKQMMVRYKGGFGDEELEGRIDIPSFFYIYRSSCLEMKRSFKWCFC